MRGDVLRTTFQVSLDWSGPEHWAATAASCRRCATATRGQDDNGAIHQSCKELELAEAHEKALAAELAAERFGPRSELVDERYSTGGAP